MKTRSGVRRGATALLAASLVALAGVIPGSASARGGGGGGDNGGNGNQEQADHWGVITRNTIGSPVAMLRAGPFGSYGVTGPAGSPPYGQGSLGIEVAVIPTDTPFQEKVDFGNEVDFYGKPVSDLNQVGFHVFQTAENIDYGGATNMPNIAFEIDPNLTNSTSNYSRLVWRPPGTLAINRWSPYLDATQTGTWYLTGDAGTATGCDQSAQCTFATVKAELDDGGDAATIYTAAVGKGRDYMWIGAVDGLRINFTIYDFEPTGVRARPVM